MANYSNLTEKIIDLINKSRKAIRLYSQVTRSRYVANFQQPSSDEKYGELVAKEWLEANSRLVRNLTELLKLKVEAPPLPLSLDTVLNLHKREFKECDAQNKVKLEELMSAIHGGDYIKAAALATELIALSARLSANKAVCHEIELLLKSNKTLTRNDRKTPDSSTYNSAFLQKLAEKRKAAGDQRIKSFTGKLYDSELSVGRVLSFKKLVPKAS